MTKKTDNSKRGPSNFITNHKIPSIWVDNLNLGVRGDGNCVLRFSETLPEGSIEQSRLITNKNILKAFVGLMCKSLDYYPTKESTKKSKTI